MGKGITWVGVDAHRKSSSWASSPRAVIVGGAAGFTRPPFVMIVSDPAIPKRSPLP
jgi:hypothetical protein